MEQCVRGVMLALCMQLSLMIMNALHCNCLSQRKQVKGLVKFQILITSYETMLADVSDIGKVRTTPQLLVL